MYGSEVTIIGRKSATQVWVARKFDNAIRTYNNSEFRCKEGAYRIWQEIKNLPFIDRETATAMVAALIEKASATSDPS